MNSKDSTKSPKPLNIMAGNTGVSLAMVIVLVGAIGAHFKMINELDMRSTRIEGQVRNVSDDIREMKQYQRSANKEIKEEIESLGNETHNRLRRMERDMSKLRERISLAESKMK